LRNRLGTQAWKEELGWKAQCVSMVLLLAVQAVMDHLLASEQVMHPEALAQLRAEEQAEQEAAQAQPSASA
jgi:hypothetical protein